jgi:hypothetical protein
MASPLLPALRPIEALEGTWKRCLQSRVFGTFSLKSDQNCFVVVEREPDVGEGAAGRGRCVRGGRKGGKE